MVAAMSMSVINHLKCINSVEVYIQTANYCLNNIVGLIMLVVTTVYTTTSVKLIKANCFIV